MTDRPIVYAGIGSRETPQEVLEYMTELACVWAESGCILRSGGARGADTAFEKGASAKEIYRPEDATPEALTHAAKFHPNWHACGPYARKLHARNSIIMLGPSLNDPVDLVVCWTPNGVKMGGTAQALRIADYYKITVVNLGDEVYGFNNKEDVG